MPMYVQYFICSAARRAPREREADVDVSVGGAVRHDLGRRPLLGHARPARIDATRPLQVLRRRPQIEIPGMQLAPFTQSIDPQHRI